VTPLMTPNVTLYLCSRPLEITSRVINGGDTKATRGLTSSGIFQPGGLDGKTKNSCTGLFSVDVKRDEQCRHGGLSTLFHGGSKVAVRYDASDYSERCTMSRSEVKDMR